MAHLAPRALLLSMLAGCVGPPEVTTDAGVCLVDEAPPPQSSTVVGRRPADVYAAAYAPPRTPPATLAAWQARELVVRDLLWAGAALPRARAVPTAITLSTRVVDGVRIEDLLIEGFEGMQIPAALYTPADATTPIPGVVVNVGHDAAGQNAGYIRQISWRLAKNGVAALSLDWLGMGTRFADDQRHLPMGFRSYLAGLLPQQPMLDEPLRAWEYLQARAEIDPARVAMVGQSGGGVVSMHLAAMEPGIAAAVVVDLTVTNDYLEHPTMGGTLGWGDPDSFVVGVHGQTSHGEILAAIAPRPLMLLTGDDDAIAPTAVAAVEAGFTRAIYELAGASDVFEHRGFATAHCYCEAKIAATLEFLGRHLLGTPIVSTAQPPPSSAPMATAQAGTPRWSDLLTPRLAVAPAPPTTPGDAVTFTTALRAQLAAWLSPGQRTPGDFVDLVGPERRDCTTTLLWISDDGTAPPAALARRGVWTIQLTPFGQGPDVLAASGDDQRFITQKGLQVGLPLMRLGVEDVAWAARGARSLGSQTVLAVCDGRSAALVCLHAAALPGTLDGLVVAGLPRDYADLMPLDQPLPLGYLATPGLAQQASPDMLLSSMAPRPLFIIDALLADHPFAAAVYAAAGAADDLVAALQDPAAAAAQLLDRFGVQE